MDKQPLSKEQVEEIIAALEDEEFEDDAELLCLSGDDKTTYIEVETDADNRIKLYYGYLNDDCKSSLPTPIYQHELKVLDLLFMGEEAEGCAVNWELESDQYKMPEDKELLEALTDALEEHKEECYFDPDFYAIDDVYDEWDEDDIRTEIEEQLEGENFAVIDGELYSYEGDINDLLEELCLDQDQEYELLDYEQAVQFLLDSDIEFLD